jgi:hypothetical protein
LTEPQQMPPFQPGPQPAHGRPRRRARRFVAGLAATAVVAGVGGAGLGYAVGHAVTGDNSTTASNGTQQRTSSDG